MDTLPPVLCSAARLGDEGAVRGWLARGGAVDATDDPSGYTLLMCSAQFRQLGVVQLLLSQGASTNIQNKDGRTALMLASLGFLGCKRPGLPAVRALLDAGADPHAKHGGVTALAFARTLPASDDRTAIMQLLQQRMRAPRSTAAASSSSSAAATASSSTDEPVVTGSRTREQIEAEKRKNAIDLDTTPAAKRPKVEKPTPATAPAPAPSTPAPAAQEVEGLAALVKGLAADVQAAAGAWCAEQKLASIELIAEGELDDVFVAALGFKPPAVGAEVVLRKRLAKLRGAA